MTSPTDIFNRDKIDARTDAAPEQREAAWKGE